MHILQLWSALIIRQNYKQFVYLAKNSPRLPSASRIQLALTCCCLGAV